MATTTLSRHIAAPRTAVYAALLDAQTLPCWRVPHGMRMQIHRFEPRPGGHFRISLHYDDPEQPGKSSAHTDTYAGVFESLEPGVCVVERLAFESRDAALQGEMRITTRLSDDAATGTRIEIYHEGLPAAVAPQDNEAGWQMALDRLARLLEGP